MSRPTSDQPPKRNSLWWLASWGTIPLSVFIAMVVASGISDAGWGWGQLGALLISLFFGAILCIVLCIVSLARRERFGGLSLIPAIPCALILLVAGVSHIDTERMNHESQLQLAELEHLKREIRRDPSIVLRERWDLKSDNIHGWAIDAVLYDPQTPLSGDLAHTMYESMPSLRDSLLRHPAFDSTFLMGKLPEAEAKAESSAPNNDSGMLMNIIKNPNCPLEVVEQVAHIREKQDAYKRCADSFNRLADQAEYIFRKRTHPPESQPQKTQPNP